MSIEKARLDPKRIPALPRREKHWNWNEKPSVLTMHKRIHRKHGPASQYQCVDQCGRMARDWSLDAKEYSDLIEDYKPRCRSCHVKRDKNWLKKTNV